MRGLMVGVALIALGGCAEVRTANATRVEVDGVPLDVRAAGDQVWVTHSFIWRAITPSQMQGYRIAAAEQVTGCTVDRETVVSEASYLSASVICP